VPDDRSARSASGPTTWADVRSRSRALPVPRRAARGFSQPCLMCRSGRACGLRKSWATKTSETTAHRRDVKPRAVRHPQLDRGTPGRQLEPRSAGAPATPPVLPPAGSPFFGPQRGIADLFAVPSAVDQRTDHLVRRARFAPGPVRAHSRRLDDPARGRGPLVTRTFPHAGSRNGSCQISAGISVRRRSPSNSSTR
jgi:hypothetical protein